MSDYEDAIRNAVKKIFPAAKTKGCHFHFSQSIIKQVDKLGYRNLYRKNEIFRKGIRMLIYVAYLPSADISQGINVIKAFFDGNNFKKQGRVILRYYMRESFAVVLHNNL